MHGLYTNIVSIVILIFSTIIFYQLIFISWQATTKLFKKSPHAKVIIIVLFTFLGHFLTILLYALAYYTYEQITAPDSYILYIFDPHTKKEFADYVYFSAITYSSLGYGEIIPTGHLRYLAMAEVLNGLVLIAWTASISYLSMQEAWDHKKRIHQHKKRKR